MFAEILLFFAMGTALGVLAGLVPGIHPNTVLVMLLPVFWLLGGASPYPVLTLVVSMAVTNTIVNFIPSIFLGAPDPGTCLSVLPGHRMLMSGRGYEALALTVTGGVSVTLMSALAFPLLLWALPLVYEGARGCIHWLLLAVLATLVWHEKGTKKVYSMLMFALAGAAGFITLSHLPSGQALFPALTGLFGLSVIITSMTQRTCLPAQTRTSNVEAGTLKGSVSGWLSGMFVGILPGIGSAQAGVLAGRLLRGKNRDFLVALGGINTANIIFTFIMLHAAGKTRSGAALALQEVLGAVTSHELMFIMLISLMSCFTASLITLELGSRSLRFLRKVNYTWLNAGVLAGLLVLLAALGGGVQGLVLACLCAVLGLACTGLGVNKMYLMGFLMLPTILHFSGLASVFLF